MPFIDDISDKFKNIIPDAHLARAFTTLGAELQPMKELLEQRTIPKVGWTESQVASFISFLARLDTDKDPIASRVGEREGRVVNSLVENLCAGFCHGIGRSGEIAASQPKAPGGSILNALANRFAKTILRKNGLPNVKGAILLPLSTGMSIFLSLAACRSLRPGTQVVYPRVDHQSPLRGIAAAGYEACIVEPVIEGDAVNSDLESIQAAINSETAAILSTTTFFPPREPDDVKGIAKIAADLNVPHIINNAYGVQSPDIMQRVRSAIDAGRVDYIVQSTDKNFLTPVGGAIVAAPTKEGIEVLSHSFAGRATAAPAVQFFAAMLSLGLEGYQKLVTEQQEQRCRLEEGLRDVSSRHGERVLEAFNPIACGMTLAQTRKKTPKEIGGALYNLRVTGPRALDPLESSWGTCVEGYPTSYITMNAAIGASAQDIDGALAALDRTLSENPGR
jgi:O-phospho-L-seryl-tRNASec:L-selenocysteinyl-tRNA synthase